MVLKLPQNGSVLSLSGQDGAEALLADHYVSPVFTLFIAPNDDLPSISLQFLLILIIQKPILHQNKLKLKHLNQNSNN